MARVRELVTVAECLSYMGLADSANAHQVALLANDVKPRVERAIRQELRSGLTTATYSEYLPVANPSDLRDRLRFNLSAFHVADGGMILQLNELPVREIISVYADYSGVSRGGQGPNAFPASTLLTSGQDYFLDVRKPGFCDTGALIRVDFPWPSEARSVLVKYIAGYSIKEMLGDVEDYRVDASDLRMGVLITVAANFIIADAASSSDDIDAIAMAMGGRISSERLVDWSTTYNYPERDDSTSVINKVFIPPRAAEMMGPYKRTNDMVS